MTLREWISMGLGVALGFIWAWTLKGRFGWPRWNAPTKAAINALDEYDSVEAAALALLRMRSTLEARRVNTQAVALEIVNRMANFALLKEGENRVGPRDPNLGMDMLVERSQPLRYFGR